MLSHIDEKTADEALKRFNFSFIEIDEFSAIHAAKFRKKYYKRNLSYADCLGYILAKKLGFRFLTGDEAFKNVENTEFVA